jgi:hypothetical protein
MERLLFHIFEGIKKIFVPLLILLGKQMKTEYAVGSKMGTTEKKEKVGVK